MTAEILIKFARKGIILSPEAYHLIASSENPLNLSSEIIVKLKSGNYSKDMVPVDVNTLKKMEGLNLKSGREDLAIKTPTPDKEKAVTKPLVEKPEQPTTDTKPLVQQPTTDTKPHTPEEKGIMRETAPLDSEKLKQPTTEEKPEQPTTDTKPQTDKKPVNPGYASEHVVKIEDTEVSEDTKLKYKRNLTESKLFSEHALRIKVPLTPSIRGTKMNLSLKSKPIFFSDLENDTIT